VDQYGNPDSICRTVRPPDYYQPAVTSTSQRRE